MMLLFVHPLVLLLQHLHHWHVNFSHNPVYKKKRQNQNSIFLVKEISSYNFPAAYRRTLTFCVTNRPFASRTLIAPAVDNEFVLKKPSSISIIITPADK
jgi:hypothetical protein